MCICTYQVVKFQEHSTPIISCETAAGTGYTLINAQPVQSAIACLRSGSKAFCPTQDPTQIIAALNKTILLKVPMSPLI